MEIVVPSFVHYLEVLDGDDGERTHGTPLGRSLLFMIRSLELFLNLLQKQRKREKREDDV